MSAIPDEVIEQVRDSADMVHLLGEYVALKRTGADYRGPCPFHGGTKRNFAVIPRKQMFYCFVCHEGGDVFTFFMKRFGMDYPTAVREVAAKVGVVIPDRPTGGPDPREPLYSAVAVAAEWYAKQLREGAEGEVARKYLASRGFAGEPLHPLGLGFAPKGDAFLEAMKTFGIAPEVLLDAGLLVRREDESLRPRFWGRLLFPIHDLRGRVVGFGGRVLGDGEPKYLNSPDSRIFHKGQLLYNLHHARSAIRRAEQAIVVEGYFDVLRAVAAGVEHVVAPLGTACTADQAALLKRYTTDVVLLYDSDRAGMRASFRAGDEMLRASLRVTIATLPQGEDPDSIVVKGGAEALNAIVDDGIDVFERKLQLLERKGWMASLAGRRKALDRLLPTLRAARDPVTQDLYVGRAAESLGITPESIRREVDAGPPRSGRFAREGGTSSRRKPGSASPERDLLYIMVNEPDWRSRIVEVFPPNAELNEGERELFEIVAAQPIEVRGGQLAAVVQSMAAREVLDHILEQPWRSGGLDVNALVAGAVGKIESRDVAAKIEEIDRRISVVSEREKLELLQQKRDLLKQRKQRNPNVWNLNSAGRSSAV